MGSVSTRFIMLLRAQKRQANRDNRTLLTKELVGLYDQLDLNIPRSEIDRFSVDAIRDEISKATAFLKDQELMTEIQQILANEEESAGPNNDAKYFLEEVLGLTGSQRAEFDRLHQKPRNLTLKQLIADGQSVDRLFRHYSCNRLRERCRESIEHDELESAVLFFEMSERCHAKCRRPN